MKELLCKSDCSGEQQPNHCMMDYILNINIKGCIANRRTYGLLFTESSCNDMWTMECLKALICKDTNKFFKSKPFTIL